MRILLGFLAAVFLSNASYAHDFYGSVKRGRDNFPCCDGGPKGDCEPLELDQIDLNDGKTILIYSKRYSSWVRVSDKDVEWKFLDEDPLKRPGHWCGKPHTALKYPASDPVDPTYHTYCAFLAPPGF